MSPHYTSIGYRLDIRRNADTIALCLIEDINGDEYILATHVETIPVRFAANPEIAKLLHYTTNFSEYPSLALHGGLLKKLAPVGG